MFERRDRFEDLDVVVVENFGFGRGIGGRFGACGDRARGRIGIGLSAGRGLSEEFLQFILHRCRPGGPRTSSPTRPRFTWSTRRWSARRWGRSLRLLLREMIDQATEGHDRDDHKGNEVLRIKGEQHGDDLTWGVRYPEALPRAIDVRISVSAWTFRSR